MCRLGLEEVEALPLNGRREHLRLWVADPSGDIRKFGTCLLHPSCSRRLLGGRREASAPTAERHSHRLGLLDRVSELLSVTHDLSNSTGTNCSVPRSTRTSTTYPITTPLT